MVLNPARYKIPHNKKSLVFIIAEDAADAKVWAFVCSLACTHSRARTRIHTHRHIPAETVHRILAESAQNLSRIPAEYIACIMRIH